nr:DNA repair protein [uncultured bacterium]
MVLACWRAKGVRSMLCAGAQQAAAPGAQVLKIMRPLLCVCLLGSLVACKSAYYAGLEKVGIPKRELLQRRVEKAQDTQEEVKEQVGSALDRFRAVVHVEGGELEERYDTLRGELSASEQKAEELDDRIDAVENVAEALFDEWEDELDDYKRPELRASSERRLNQTRRQYTPMMTAMRRAQERVEPVLEAFNDVVLSLKHQLNAQAIAGVESELETVQRDVDALVADMNRSINQAAAFLRTLEQPTEGG